MEDKKEILVSLKKPDGETLVIQEPDYVVYPSASQPFWTVVKDKLEIHTTGEVWIEKALKGNEVVCEDAVVCTGTRCFHKLPHPKSEDCGNFCEADKAANCRPYRI